MGFIYPPSYFHNAQNAFVMLYDLLIKEGHMKGNGTKALYNVGFYIENPRDNEIRVDWRNWSRKYAQREWQWYLSGDRSVAELKKFAPIWDTMHNGDDIVNSNYGYLWSENDQLDNAISQLRSDNTTRQAWVTLFDGKQKSEYEKDTPCTLNIGFEIINGLLCMNVLMRSNDIWFGFCNDQYCFSKLQQIVAAEVGVDTGWYYHYAANFHVYERHYTVRDDYFKNNKNDIEELS